MKRNKLVLALVAAMFLCANSAFATNYLNWGETDTIPLLKRVLPTDLLSAGVSHGGAVSMTTADLAVPTAYAYVRKAISSDSNFSQGTLADGDPGQILVLFITSVSGSGTYTVTPTTKTGFTSIKFTAAKQQATFLFVDTLGWIILDHAGAPTINIP